MVQNNADEFVKNSAFSYAAKAISILLGFLYLFVVANSLGPEEYGNLAFMMDFLATGALVLGFNALAETLVVFIPKTMSRKLSGTFLKIGFLISALLSVLAYIFPETVVWIAQKGTPELVQLVVAVVFLNVVSTLIISILTGTKNFGKILQLAFTENILNLGLASLFLFYFNGGVIEVVYAKMISLLSIIVIGWIFYRKLPLSDADVSWGEIKKFGFLSAALGFVRRGSTQIILVFVGWFIEQGKLGFYYLMLKISTYFVELPITSLNNVLLPTISAQEKDPEKMQRTVSLSVKFYLLVSALFSLILVLIGPLFVALIFPGYSEGIYLLPLFAVYFLMGFDISLGTFYRAIKRIDIILKSSSIAAIPTIISGYFLLQEFSVAGLVIALILNRGIQVIYFYLDIRKHGYKIQFIPNAKDIKFFYSIASESAKKAVNKASYFFSKR